MKPRGPGPGWTVVVTGASSGLGRVLAVELAQAGCRLVLTGRDPDRLRTTVTEVQAAGAEVQGWTADLGTQEGVGSFIDTVSRSGWTVDALVNNAGAGHAGPWAEGTTESDRALVQLLIEAPLALTRAWLPEWRLKGRGAVLNVASTGAFQPGPQTAVYYACKAFLMNWSVALAREERRWLAVTTLCPGAMKTGFAAAAGKLDVPGAPGPERYAKLAVAAWQKNRGLVVPGWFNKAQVFVSRLAPVAGTAAAVDGIQRSVKLPSVKKV